GVKVAGFHTGSAVSTEILFKSNFPRVFRIGRHIPQFRRTNVETAAAALRIALLQILFYKAKLSFHRLLQVYGFIRADRFTAGTLRTLQFVYRDFPLDLWSLAWALSCNFYCFFGADILAEHTVIAIILIYKQLLERHGIF